MDVLGELIRSHGITVLDGGWGTELQKMGLGYGEYPDMWNLDHPDRVAKVAAAWVRAGSDLILTNTFMCHPFNLSVAGQPEKAFELAQAGARISVEAAGGKKSVFGSLGPISKMAPRRGTGPEMVKNGYRTVARGLIEGGVQGLVIETMTDLDDMTAAILGAKEAEAPAIVVSVSPKTEQAQVQGRRQAPWDQMLSAAYKLGIQGMGLNCGAGVAQLAPLAVKLAQASPVPVWVKASAGIPQVSEGKMGYPVDSRAFMKFMPALAEAGVKFLGGCCGTSPEYIEYIRVWVDEYQGNLLPV